MNLKFITGNKYKLDEVRSILGDICNVDNLELDLEEIQDLDSKNVIKDKLERAKELGHSMIFCEDVSLSINCLNGFPGPLVKWFLSSLGSKGVYNLVSKYDDHSAIAKTMIGFYDGSDVYYFEGSVKGTLISPKGDSSFGFDPIFVPDGYNQTFGEMDKSEKNSMSHRRCAVDNFKEFLKSKNY